MNVDLGWSLTWGGETWTAASLTGEQVADLALLLGDQWESLSPTSSPTALLSHLAVHVAYASGVELRQAMLEVKTATLAQLLAALTDVPAAPAANAG